MNKETKTKSAKRLIYCLGDAIGVYELNVGSFCSAELISLVNDGLKLQGKALIKSARMPKHNDDRYIKHLYEDACKKADEHNKYLKDHNIV
jgi:hypothetical protein